MGRTSTSGTSPSAPVAARMRSTRSIRSRPARSLITRSKQVAEISVHGLGGTSRQGLLIFECLVACPEMKPSDKQQYSVLNQSDPALADGNGIAGRVLTECAGAKKVGPRNAS